MKKIAISLPCFVLLALSHQIQANTTLIASPIKTLECSVSDNSDLMYARFLNLWSEDTGMKDGHSTRKTRNMNPSEQAEAIDCLKKSELLNNCKAIHVLELFYRFGEEELGIRKDLALADKYLERKNLVCSQSSANPSVKRDWRKRASMIQFSITRVEPPMSPAPYFKR